MILSPMDVTEITRVGKARLETTKQMLSPFDGSNPRGIKDRLDSTGQNLTENTLPAKHTAANSVISLLYCPN